MPLTENDIEAELSYAYLHAVAAFAGCECKVSGRLSDNHKIDADIRCFDDFGPDTMNNVTLQIQLKATRQQLDETSTTVAFDLDLETYNTLRFSPSESAQFLVLLRLPDERSQWLSCDPRALSLRRCAYWLSLHGAPASRNRTSQRVYFLKRNRLTPAALRALLEISARGERIDYESS